MTTTNGQGPPVPVALYDRLSTTAQAAEGYAGEGHLRELRAEMARTGRTVIEEVRDDGLKRFMFDRPGLRRLMELAEAGRIREVWGWSWQRFGEGSVPARIEEDLADYGVALRALDDGGEGLGGEILRAVGGVLSANDQRERVRKAGMGKRSKARQGRVLGGGQKARFGFARVRNDKGKVVGYEVVPGEMAVVRRILGELAAGASIRSVQTRLEEDGIAAPKGGRRWTRDTIKKISREDSYKAHSPEELRGLVAEGLMGEEVRASLDPGKPWGIDFYGRTRSRFLSRETGKRIAEPAPRSEWVAVPVCLEGARIDRATADAARRNVEANRATSTAGEREWELSRGFLRCGDCGRSMVAVVTRGAKGTRDYHYYACYEFRHARRAAPPRCPNRRSHRAAELERAAARLCEDNANPRTLAALYERAVREEEERLGLGDPEAARRSHAEASAGLEAANEERKGYLRLAARGAVSDAELDDLLSELDAKRDELAGRLRQAEEAMNARRAPAWSPVHAAWEEDPDALTPSEFLTLGASVEQTRAAYRRLGATFEVGADGGLTMRMEVPLGGRPSCASGDHSPT